MCEETVPASSVQEGDSLPGLDNGYVIEVNTDDTFSIREGTYSPYVLPDDSVCITFNTADGGEGYLLVPGDTPITVKR